MRLMADLPSAEVVSTATPAPTPSHITDDAARGVIVPAVATGILFTGVAPASIASITDGSWLPAVICAIVEDPIAVLARRDRRDDGVRLHSD